MLHNKRSNFNEKPEHHNYPGGSVVKNPPANAGDAGDTGLIPGSGRSTERVNGKPPQENSCLENSMAEEPGRL